MTTNWIRTLAVVFLAGIFAISSTPVATAYRHLVLRPIGYADSLPLSDGRRVAYALPNGLTRLIDTHTGKFTVRRVPTDCSLTAIGGGYLLYHCAESSGRIGVVEQADSGAQVPVRAPIISERISPPSLVSIGAHWVSGGEFAYKQESRFLINWRTGSLVFPQSSRKAYVDLNASSPMMEYCPPLERSLGGLGELEPELSFDPPFALEGELVLRRCGSNRKVLLVSSRKHLVYDASIQGGVASWDQEKRWFVTRLLRRAKQWHGAIYELVLDSAGLREAPTRSAAEAFSFLATSAQTVFEVAPLSKLVEGKSVEVVYSGRMPK